MMSHEAAMQARERGSGGARIDLHAHSRASRKPVIPLLGHIDCPECYSPPERVYELARQRGMDFVTLTDHDTIEGALELVERGFERVLIGEEITTRFPSDGREMHVLVWGITPDQHEEIERLELRADIHALAGWIRERDLAHALAHPLHQQQGRLAAWHVERCALLFSGFELINGAHSSPGSRSALERSLGSLTRERLCALEARHGMAAFWPADHQRAFVGGSDDHALLNVGRSWTTLGEPGERIESVESALQAIRDGKTRVGGQVDGPAALAHQITTVAVNYYARKVHPKTTPRTQLAASKLARFVGVKLERPTRAALTCDALKRKFGRGRRASFPILAALLEELPSTLRAHRSVRTRLDQEEFEDDPPAGRHRELAAFMDDLSEKLSASMAGGAFGALRAGDRHATFDYLLALSMIGAAQLPDLLCLFQHNRERRLVAALERSFGLRRERSLKIALFTDTLHDVNGVARFVHAMADEARRAGDDLRVFASTGLAGEDAPGVVNFEPVLRAPLPKYPQLELVAPPAMRMLREVDSFQPDLVHVSTPGPVGAVGLAAARMLEAPLVGVHHTDFPSYLERYLGAESKAYVERAMRLFYASFDLVLARSSSYERQISHLGVPQASVSHFAPGVDIETFSPLHRDSDLWARYPGVSVKSVKVIYVGRLSEEKNVDHLARVWRRASSALQVEGLDAELIIVGDGPRAGEMRDALTGSRTMFLGFREGQELSTLYASSDLFLFPSETDTLGQAVLEAHASGLAAIVTDVGGPAEMIDDGETGFVIPASQEERWVNRIVELVRDPKTLREIGRSARARAQRRSMTDSYRSFREQHVRLLSRLGFDDSSPNAPQPSVGRPGARRSSTSGAGAD